jgi:hypothetical protein
LLTQLRFIDGYHCLEELFLVNSGVGTLLYLQKDGVVQHAITMPTGYDDHNISTMQLTFRNEVSLIVIDIDFAVAASYNDDFGSPRKASLDGAVGMTADFTTGWIYHEAYLLLEFRWCQEGCVFRVELRTNNKCERFVTPDDVFHMLHLDRP